MSEQPHQYRVGLLITSDRAASGERDDECEAALRQALDGTAFSLVAARVISDDPEAIVDGLEQLLAHNLDLLFTSGGTGLSLRDNTPEATRPFINKPTPGVDEAIRRFSEQHSPHAPYSRAISGISGNTFVINLPGSPNAVREIVAFLLPTLEHPLRLLRGTDTDCTAGPDAS